MAAILSQPQCYYTGGRMIGFVVYHGLCVTQSKKYKYGILWISDHWNDTGFWNPSIWKTRTHLSYTVHTAGIAWLSDTHVSFSLYCPNFMCPSMWKRKKMNNFMCLLEFECTKRLKMYSHAIPDIMVANDLVMKGARASEAMILTLVFLE